jgi:uncharacterized membrane protein (UPF0136 family)
MHWATDWPWLALLVLGAYHGLNPGMGWLFAVALGLQEHSTRAVLRALPPIALGHLLSIGLVVMALELVQPSIPHRALRFAVSAILLAFGLFRLVRSRHPRWVGMHVGFRDLTLWSFLMASAHGAGLMLAPILLGWPQEGHMHMMASVLPLLPAAFKAGAVRWWLPVVIHTLGYLAMTALVALVVYRKLGVAILRRAWFNLDLVWAIALMATGILSLHL